MKVIVITGGIGAGKSIVSGMLEQKGIPVYDSDSAVKELYQKRPDLKAMVRCDLFENPQALKALEDALYPPLLVDFEQWATDKGVGTVGFESAVILQKPFFSSFGDYVLYVDAPVQIRRDRAIARGGITKESIDKRLALQKDDSSNPRINFVIRNVGTLEYLDTQVDEFLKLINYVKDRS